MIPYTAIESSLLHYITQGMGAVSTDTGQPVDFDPDAQDKEQWMVISSIEIIESPSREPNREARVLLTMESNSRSQDVRNDALKLMEEAKALVDRYTVTIRDYESSGDPVLGYIQFKEPRVRQVPKTLWQCWRATVEGDYYGAT